MNIFKMLFSSDTATKAITSGVDKAFYTPEEKADDFLNMLKAYEPFKIAQRLLMLIVALPFVLVFIISVAVYTVSPEAAAALVNMNTSVLGEPMKWITIFYFGGGAVEGVASKLKGNVK
jgi:hypothetical protein